MHFLIFCGSIIIKMSNVGNSTNFNQPAKQYCQPLVTTLKINFHWIKK